MIGQTQLSNTTIGGTLNVGLVHIDDLNADISSLNGLLSFQQGTVTVDNNGNISTNSTVSAKKVQSEEFKVLGAKSAGTSTLSAGTTTITVPALSATPTARILVTPTTLTDRALVVTNKANGQFTVAVKTPDIVNINFDWIVIQN